MLVEDLLSDPPQKLIITSPAAFVYEAAEQLSKHRIGLLLVLDAAKDVAGVISERDIVAAWGNKLVEVDSARVGDVMTKAVVTVERQSSLTDAASAMKDNEIRHLVVVEQDAPVAIISIRDVLAAFASELLRSGLFNDSDPAKELVEAMAAYKSAGGLSIRV